MSLRKYGKRQQTCQEEETFLPDPPGDQLQSPWIGGGGYPSAPAEEWGSSRHGQTYIFWRSEPCLLARKHTFFIGSKQIP